MKEKIVKHLKQLEVEKDITILLATESGSRAWGCPSPDSDYDVRIIYKRPKSQYLEIDDKPDTINYFHGELLDINGWDIKKTLKLIRKSNVTPFEWAQSPIIYMEVDGFRETIIDLCKAYFQPRHSINHYKGIDKNSYINNDLQQEIKLKKLFYVLRPIMAAKWIIQKGEVPPMDIPNLIQIIDNKEIVDHIHELLKIKETVDEDYLHQLDPIITNFISAEFEFIQSAQVTDSNEEINSYKLNQTFKNIIED